MFAQDNVPYPSQIGHNQEKIKKEPYEFIVSSKLEKSKGCDR